VRKKQNPHAREKKKAGRSVYGKLMEKKFRQEREMNFLSGVNEGLLGWLEKSVEQYRENARKAGGA